MKVLPLALCCWQAGQRQQPKVRWWWWLLFDVGHGLLTSERG